MSIILVCGSRNITNYSVVEDAIDESPFKDENKRDNSRVEIPDMDSVIHGNARGVDRSADRYCALRDIDVKKFTPNYPRYGDRAPLIRNRVMISEADGIIAVWDGNSRGTKHTIDNAKDNGFSLLEKKKIGAALVKYLVKVEQPTKTE